jgi:outer membrane protein OmpA-like peptidoglycan-associated protein
MAASSGALMAPERDERGVVVVLRELFDGDSLKPGAKERLAELDRVSAANDRFPIAVVLHSDKPLSAAERQKWQARGASIAGALGAVSKTKKLVFVADDAEPLVGRKSPERALNARVEIVFISPEAL